MFFRIDPLLYKIYSKLSFSPPSSTNANSYHANNFSFIKPPSFYSFLTKKLAVTLKGINQRLIALLESKTEDQTHVKTPPPSPPRRPTRCFTSWGRETPRKYSREDLQEALSALAMTEDYGYVLRAKGMVPCDDGQTWLHFDLVPEEFQIREGGADYTGRPVRHRL